MKETPAKVEQMQPLLLSLGRAITQRRLDANVTQLELAMAVGVTRSYLSDIERGRRNVTLNTLESVAGALETTSAKLLMHAEKLSKTQAATTKRRPTR